MDNEVRLPDLHPAASDAWKLDFHGWSLSIGSHLLQFLADVFGIVAAAFSMRRIQFFVQHAHVESYCFLNIDVDLCKPLALDQKRPGISPPLA